LIVDIRTVVNVFLQEKAVETAKQKEERGENLSPRNRKACHRVSTALLQSLAEIGTQSTMKNNKKTLHDSSPHIPKNKTPKRNISPGSSMNEMPHTDSRSSLSIGRLFWQPGGVYNISYIIVDYEKKQWKVVHSSIKARTCIVVSIR
jgi:hypothetical protein